MRSKLPSLLEYDANYGKRGYSANLALQNTGKFAWRYQIGSAFILSLPLFLCITRLCAESPRYLIKRGVSIVR